MVPSPEGKSPPMNKNHHPTSRQNIPPLLALRGLAILSLALISLAPQLTPAAACEPNRLDKSRWEPLTEVQVAELNNAHQLFNDAAKRPPDRRRQAYRAAASSFERFMAAHPNAAVNPYCQLMIGETLRLADQPHNAITEFQFVRDLAPESDDARWAHLRIAQSHQAAGDANKAITVYADILQQAGKHPTAFYAAVFQARILEEQQLTERRAETLQIIIDRFPEYRNAPRDLQDRRDAFHAAAAALARFKLANQQIEPALQLLLLLDNQNRARARLASIANEVIREQFRNENTREQAKNLASTLATQLIDWLTESPAAEGHQTLASVGIELLLVSEQRPQALQFAEGLIKLYPQAHWPWERLIALHTTAKNLDLAIQTASRARKTFNDNDWSLITYANLVLESGQTDLAIDTLDLLKNNVQRFTLTSDILRKAGQTQQAIERRRKISEIDPAQAPNVFMWVGDALKDTRKWDDAIAEYNQAANEPANLYAIADTLSRAGRHQASYDQYAGIASVFDAERPRAWWAMAHQLERMKKTDDAKARLRAICRQFPKSSFASQAHNRLQREYGESVTLGGQVEMDD
mgnify:CR=1 FL=1